MNLLERLTFEQILAAAPRSGRNVCVDFDNTITGDTPQPYRTGYFGKIDPEARKLIAWLDGEGFTVIVLTARPEIQLIAKYLRQNNLQVAQVTNQKPPALAYIDDRAAEWEGKLGQIKSRLREIEQLHGGGPGSGRKPTGYGKGFAMKYLEQKDKEEQEAKEKGDYKDTHELALERKRWRPLFAEEQPMKATATVLRQNNPAPTDGPDIWEVHDRTARVLHRSKDRRGAELFKEKLDRKAMKLGRRPLSLQEASRILDGRIVPLDSRLRRTTGGTGGTGGPGNG